MANSLLLKGPTWDKRILKLLRILAGVGAGISALINVTNLLRNGIHFPPLQIALRWELAIQAFTVFCLLGFVLETLPRVRTDGWFKNDDDPTVKEVFGDMQITERESRVRNTVESAKQFWGSWIFLWSVWLGLYIVWLIKPPTESSAVSGLTVLGDSLNMLSAAAFFLCYFVMTRLTAPSKTFGFLPVAFFTTAGFGLAGIAELFYVGHSTGELYPLHWLAGLVSGITMALFIGRLESGLLRINPSLIAAFYTYAIIQFSYPQMPKEPWVLLLMTSFALVLKVLLFWELRKIMSSGTIYWYMFGYRKSLEVGVDNKKRFLNRFLDQ